MITSINEFRKLFEVRNNEDIKPTTDPNQIIGDTSGYGQPKKQIKVVYNSFAHPEHANFNELDHDAAIVLHHSLQYDREIEMFPGLAKPNRYASKVQKAKMAADPIYAFHEEQARLHTLKQDELYTNSGQKKKDEEERAKYLVKAAESEKKQKAEDRAKLKLISLEDKAELERLKGLRQRLLWHHPQDDNPLQGFMGYTVADARRQISQKIDRIKKKYTSIDMSELDNILKNKGIGK